MPQYANFHDNLGNSPIAHCSAANWQCVLSCAVNTECSADEAGNTALGSQQLECSGMAATDLLHSTKQGLVTIQPLSTLEQFSQRASDAVTAATNLYDCCLCRPRPTHCCQLACTNVLPSVNQSVVTSACASLMSPPPKLQQLGPQLSGDFF